VPCETLKEYLIAHRIKWIEDTSNNDNQYKRNFIRNKIIPLLKQEFPNINENISRNASNISQSMDLINHLCDFQGKALTIKQLKKLPEDLQTTLFYHWLSHKNLPLPDKVALHQITHDFIYAREDKHPSYKNKSYQLMRWQDRIYCLQNFSKINPEQCFVWQTGKPFIFPNGCGMLTYRGNKSLELTIKFNQTGQKIKLQNRGFSKTVKQLFNENKVSNWEKPNTPFIYQNNKLVSLGHSWSNSDGKFSSIKLSIDVLLY
jgi:tRNA(Ile)-lysidine synthase